MNLPDTLIDHPDGEIRLTGHRISLMNVVDLHNEGVTAEGIAVEYPGLRLAHIHKALAFYLDNQAEVDAYVARCRVRIERDMAMPSRGPGLVELRQRLEARRRGTGTSYCL